MAPTKALQFGRFELFVDEYRLLEDGVEIAVEPKAVELIAYLAASGGAVVGKEELFEKVWLGQAVGDAALARCVHVARKALGEDASEPRWILTIHGRGYRFAENLGVDPTEPDSRAPRKASKSALLLLIPVILLAVAFVLWNGNRSPPEAEVPSDKVDLTVPADKVEILALVGLKALSDDRELDLVGISVIDLLHRYLGDTRGLILRAPIYDQGSEHDEELLTGIAARTGASALLTVTVSDSLDPGRAKVSIILHEYWHDGERSTPLGEYSLPRLEKGASLEDLLILRDAVANRVNELLSPMLASPDPRPAATPRDPEAYRLYLMAYLLLRESYCGGASGAIELLERSLEIDDRYGPAWLWLGVAHYNRVWACGANASAYGPALEAIDRAAEVDPDLRQARIQKAALLVETGRLAEAFEVLDQEIELHGESPILLGTRSYALRIAGFLDPSMEDLSRLLELDPLAFENGMAGGSPNTLLYLDRRDEFLEVLPTLEMAYFRYYRGFVALLQKREQDVRSILGPAYREAPSEIFGRMSLALISILDGDQQEALEIVQAISRQRESLGARDSEITYKQAQLLSLAGDASSALEQLQRSVDQGFSCPRCIMIDPTFESLRARPDYLQILDQARRSHSDLAQALDLEEELGE